MIRVLGFKQEFRADGRVLDMVHYTSGDAMTDTGEPTHSTWERVCRLLPPDVIENDDGGLKAAALRSQWAQIEPHYTAWKAGHEIPETGTPLGAWPAISQDQGEALRSVGLRTVEDVAKVSEAILSRPPLPQMRELQRQAKMFLEGRDKASLEYKLAQLEEQNAAMMEMLAEQKPKRGRPRKEEGAEAA